MQNNSWPVFYCGTNLNAIYSTNLTVNLNDFFRQYQDFLEDLEEDDLLRKNVNIFRGEDANLTFSSWNNMSNALNGYSHYILVCFSDASKIPVESDTDDEGLPRISLAEMMEDLSLNDATGGEGANMMTD